MCELFGMICCTFVPEFLVMLLGWLFQMTWQCIHRGKLQIISHNIKVTLVFCVLSRNKVVHWVVSWMNHRVKNCHFLISRNISWNAFNMIVGGFFLSIVIIRSIITNWQKRVLKSEGKYFLGKHSTNKKKQGEQYSCDETSYSWGITHDLPLPFPTVALMLFYYRYIKQPYL